MIPADLELAGAEIELTNEPGREYILKQAIQGLDYDYVLIDAPPSLGILTVNALTASDSVLIPIQAHYLAVQGLSRLLDVIGKIQGRLNPALTIAGVFLTQYDQRKVLNRDIADTIQRHLPEKLLKTRIRDNVALAEAPAMGQDIFTYSPKSNGAKDYETLTNEILKL
jgi:chromosome partitioning protein